MKRTFNLPTIALLAALAIGVLVLPACMLTPDLPPLLPDLPQIIVDPLPPNAEPVADKPLIFSTNGWNEPTSIDLRYRAHGCDSSGDPIWYTGAYDPDGDLLEYHIKVTGPDANGNTIAYSLFDKDGNRVDNRWLPANYFDLVLSNVNDPSSELEQDAIVYCVIGHGGESPLYPMSKPGFPECDPPAQIVAGQPRMKQIGVMRVMYFVRDPQGARAVGVYAGKVFGWPCLQ